MRELLWMVGIVGLCGGELSAADSAPALQWVKTLGGSGLSSVAGAATDAAGNLYLVGTTSSIDFPTAAAAQRNPGGSPLVRINSATGVAEKLYPAGLSMAHCLAADPRNPQTLYAGADSAIFQSVDGGSTWSLRARIAGAAIINRIAVDPTNSNVLYATTSNQGVFKSVDGGLTWNAINSGITAGSDGAPNAGRIWVDPNTPQVVFTTTTRGFLRTGNGGASWTRILTAPSSDLIFDPLVPGTLYLGSSGGILKSTDDGQTFAPLSSLPGTIPGTTLPVPVSALIADPLHPGVLFAGSVVGGIFQSVDSGVTWSSKSTAVTTLLAADPNNPVIYANGARLGMVKTTDGFDTSSPVGPPEGGVGQVVVAGGNVFEVAAPGNDVFAAKLDGNGNVVYATYFGGSGSDSAAALAVAADGSLYITGSTMSVDFPTTAGAYARTLPGLGDSASFLLKLNPDGSLGWSTYFADFNSTVDALAMDGAGNLYLGGASKRNLPTTPGAYQTQFEQTYICPGLIGCFPGPTSAFVSKFNAQGSGLVYSTYVSNDGHKNPVEVAQALAVDASGNAWFGGKGNVVVVNTAGSALLATTMQPGITIAAVALDSASNVYATGTATAGYNGTPKPQFIFPATPGAFQPSPQPAIPPLSDATPGGLGDAFIIKWDSSLSRILAATLLGGELLDGGESISVDGAGNVMISGETDSKGFPTHAPFQTAFSLRSGFVAGFDPSLSHLLFSTYLGDEKPFDARAAMLDGHGNILLAGSTLASGALFIAGDPGQGYGNPGSLVVANKIALPAPPAVRLDSVVHAASRMAVAIAPGEPIVAIGTGFGADAHLVIDGVSLATVNGSATTVLAVLPDDAKISGGYVIQVSSGGTLSNAMFVPAAPASPGIYSMDNSGFGQGYILNSDGTMNSPTNPAAPGSAITIFAAGLGPFSVANGYAVTASATNAFIGGFYAYGIATVVGPVAGLPGNVYQLALYVPNPAMYADQNPSLRNFQFPPQVSVKLVSGPVDPLNFANSPLISQGGLVLNVK